MKRLDRIAAALLAACMLWGAAAQGFASEEPAPEEEPAPAEETALTEEALPEADEPLSVPETDGLGALLTAVRISRTAPPRTAARTASETLTDVSPYSRISDPIRAPPFRANTTFSASAA